MSNLETGINEQGLRVRFSPWFKLKRKYGKHFMAVDLKTAFGFMPETLIIERETSRSNVVRVCAVLTPEEIKKEDAKIAELEKQRAKLKKKGGKDGSDKQPAPKEKGQSFEIR